MDYEFPTELGPAIDALHDLRDRVKEINREAKLKTDPIEEEAKALEKHIIELFGNQAVNGASGLKAKATLKVTKVPTKVDWDAFYKYILDNNAFELLHKRITVTAWLERLEAGELVPGTQVFEKMEIKTDGR